MTKKQKASPALLRLRRVSPMGSMCKFSLALRTDKRCTILTMIPLLFPPLQSPTADSGLDNHPFLHPASGPSSVIKSQFIKENGKQSASHFIHIQYYFKKICPMQRVKSERNNRISTGHVQKVVYTAMFTASFHCFTHGLL